METFVLPDGYSISTDPARLDVEVIHGFISQSYWAKNIPRALIERMIKNSLCFGLYHRQAQVGFARLITDYTTFAYLADVFVLPDHRGKGLSKALVQAVRAHPDLQGLRRWMLVTLDAQGLYRQFGFEPLQHPERHLEIHHPHIYEQS
ncbi:MAG: GNAT family N-acetyltransferase [Methylacidiphilales bacterium]|nr:GNAT family N-acetyltransferase [Candidatus Methylacidiphilales bacterium]